MLEPRFRWTFPDAPTLDELLSKISAMALDLLPDNHPDIDPASLYLQITALREAEPDMIPSPGWSSSRRVDAVEPGNHIQFVANQIAKC